MELAEMSMQRFFSMAFLAILLLAVPLVHAQDTNFSVPEVVLDGIEFSVTLHPGATDSLSAAHYTVAGVNDPVAFALNDDGELVAERIGEVAYLDPEAHLSSGFYLEIGAEEGEIETAPVDWVFSDLLIVGTKL